MLGLKLEPSELFRWHNNVSLFWSVVMKKVRLLRAMVIVAGLMCSALPGQALAEGNCGTFISSRWSDEGSPTTGNEYTGFGEKGSGDCHETDQPLPLSETVSFTMAQTETYSLTGNLEWGHFGLKASHAQAQTQSETASRTTTCNSELCCLQKFNAYVRRSYTQCFQCEECKINGTWTKHGISRSGTVLKFPSPILTTSTFGQYDPALAGSPNCN